MAAPVHRDDFTRGEARLARGQERHAPGNILHRAGPAQGMPSPALLLQLGGGKEKELIFKNFTSCSLFSRSMVVTPFLVNKLIDRSRFKTGGHLHFVEHNNYKTYEY